MKKSSWSQTIKRIFDINNWSRIQINRDNPTLEDQSNIMLSQLIIFGLISLISQVILDYSKGLYLISGIEMFIILLLGVIYIINENGHHLTAKILVLFIINTVIFVICAVVPVETGTFLLFFPILGGSLIFFPTNNTNRLGFLCLTFIYIAVLLFTGFQPFGSINLDPTDTRVSFILNILISTGAFSILIHYLILSNTRALSKLKSNIDVMSLLTEELKLKGDHLEKTNAELDRFVYSTGHDLRAPLMSILGLINLSLLEKPSKEVHGYLKMMEDRVGRLDEFIQEIIFHSRNSRLPVQSEELSVEELFDKAIDDNKFLKNADKIQFIKSINEPFIFSDRLRLQTVINNLISNSVKYYKESEERPYVRMSSFKKEYEFVIQIEDNGTGIKEVFKEKVFEMFFRATDKNQGSGLGLYIVKETMDKLGGNISLESRHNYGTTVSLHFPLIVSTGLQQANL